MRNHAFALIIERDAGGYYGFCPQLRGSYTVGLTYDDALNKLKNNVFLYLATMPGRRRRNARPPVFVGMTWEQLTRDRAMQE